MLLSILIQLQAKRHLLPLTAPKISPELLKAVLMHQFSLIQDLLLRATLILRNMDKAHQVDLPQVVIWSKAISVC